MLLLRGGLEATNGRGEPTGFAEGKVVVEVAGEERMAVGVRVDNSAGRRGRTRRTVATDAVAAVAAARRTQSTG